MFLMQMVNAIKHYVSSPSTIVGEATSIWDLDRPIQISICNLDQFEGGLGFDNIKRYIRGSNVNKSLLTWTDTYGNLTANETMYWLFKSNIEKILLDTADITYILPYGICKYHRGFPKDIFKTEGNWKGAISIKIKDLQEKYHVFISDPSAAPIFQLPKPFLTGDRLEAKPDNKSMFYYYSIVIKETRTHLDDGSCTVYPDKAGHQSYADCVNQEIRK